MNNIKKKDNIYRLKFLGTSIEYPHEGLYKLDFTLNNIVDRNNVTQENMTKIKKPDFNGAYISNAIIVDLSGGKNPNFNNLEGKIFDKNNNPIDVKVRVYSYPTGGYLQLKYKSDTKK